MEANNVTFPVVLQYLQQQFSRFELDRLSWKAEKEALEGNLKSLNNALKTQVGLVEQLSRRIQMLEHALDQERRRGSQQPPETRSQPRPIVPAATQRAKGTNLPDDCETGPAVSAGCTAKDCAPGSEPAPSHAGKGQPGECDSNQAGAARDGPPTTNTQANPQEARQQSDAQACVDTHSPATRSAAAAEKAGAAAHAAGEKKRRAGAHPLDSPANPSSPVVSASVSARPHSTPTDGKKSSPLSKARPKSTGSVSGRRTAVITVRGANYSEPDDADDSDPAEDGGLMDTAHSQPSHAPDIGVESRQQRKRKLQHVIKSHLDAIRSIQMYSSAAPLIASASDDMTVKVWSITSAAKSRACALAGIERSGSKMNTPMSLFSDIDPIVVMRGHKQPVLRVAVSERMERIVSGDLSGHVIGWKLPRHDMTPYAKYGHATPHRACTMTGHTDAVWGVACHPTEDLAVSCSADGTVKVWRPLEHSPLVHSVQVNKTHGLSALALPPSLPNTAVVADRHGAVSCVDIHTGTVTATLKDSAAALASCILGAPAINVLAAHPISSLLYVGCEDLCIRFFDTKSGKCEGRFNAHSAGISALSMHPHGHQLASGDHNSSVRIWDIPSNSLVQELTAHGHPKFQESLQGLSFHPTGNFLASCSADGVIKVFH